MVAQCCVLGQVERHHQSLFLSVLRNVSHPGIDPFAACPAGHVCSLEVNGPRIGRSEASQRIDQLSLSVAIDAGDTKNLAGLDFEIKSRDRLDTTVIGNNKIRDRQRFTPWRRRLNLKIKHYLTTDHQFCELVTTALVWVDGPNLLAIAQDGDGIGRVGCFIEFVRDEDDRLALVGE